MGTGPPTEGSSQPRIISRYSTLGSLASSQSMQYTASLLKQIEALKQENEALRAEVDGMKNAPDEAEAVVVTPKNDDEKDSEETKPNDVNVQSPLSDEDAKDQFNQSIKKKAKRRLRMMEDDGFCL